VGVKLASPPRNHSKKKTKSKRERRAAANLTSKRYVLARRSLKSPKIRQVTATRSRNGKPRVTKNKRPEKMSRNTGKRNKNPQMVQVAQDPGTSASRNTSRREVISPEILNGHKKICTKEKTKKTDRNRVDSSDARR